jgi:1-deoxyxylulose-5-phosphate synthase
MRPFTRRRFLQTSLAGAGLLAGVPRSFGADVPQTAARFRGTDLVPLGKTGIQVTRLAQGTGFNGHDHTSAHTRQGKEAFDLLLRRSLDSGIRFIDMADLYGSHSFVKEMIKGLPRENLVLLSKIWPRKAKWVTPSGGARQEVERFCQELGVERLDICLIHCMENERWPSEFERVRDELSALKEKQVVRAVVVSCHDLGAMKVAASHPWVDVIYARVNYKGGKAFSCDGSAEEIAQVLKTARANGKAVVGMKIFGAGKLVQPEEKDASLQYVFNQGLVDAITVGMLKPEEVDDTLRRMSGVS